MVTGTLGFISQSEKTYQEHHLRTYVFVFKMDQNRGATGSMIFLFNAQIESHSRDTMA